MWGLVLFACQKDPATVLFVEDPFDLARGSETLVIFDAFRAEPVAHASIRGLSFPFDLALVQEREGPRTFVLEARRGTPGEVLARGVVAVEFHDNDFGVVTARLGPACVHFLCESGRVPVCVPERDHGHCGAPDKRRYCDMNQGCQDRPACDFDLDGMEDIDDRNPCTVDACSAEEAVLNLPRSDGEACADADIVDGECVDGVCQLRRPKPPPIVFRDPKTKSPNIAQSFTVDLEHLGPLSDDLSFHLSETSTTPPGAGDPSWVEELPKSFMFSPGEGTKTAYLWVRNAFGVPSTAPSVASILLSPDVIRIGAEPTGCPIVDRGPCSHVWPSHSEQLTIATPSNNVLQDAIDGASPGAVIWLYPAPNGEVYVGRVQVTKSLIIQGAPESDAASIRLQAPNDTVGPVFHLKADNVTLRRFTIVGRVAPDVAISAVGNSNAGAKEEGWTGGHLVEQMFFDGRSSKPPFRGFSFAIVPGDRSTIRNNWFYGWWRGIADASGRSDRRLRGTRVLHNTIVSPRPFEAIEVMDSEDVVVRNNVLMTLDERTDRAAIRADQDTRGLKVEGNLIAGWGRVVSDLVGPLPSELQLGYPGLVHMGDPRPAEGGAAIDQAVLDDARGRFDLYGNDRLVGQRPDVGAVEAPSGLRLARLPEVIKVGLESSSCPAPDGVCDFFSGSSDEVLPIVQALAAARPGSTVELYDDAGAPVIYPFESMIIDRRVHLRRAPGVADGGVIIEFPADSQGAIRVVQADDVRISGLTIRCFKCIRVIVFDLGENSEPGSELAAERGIIEGIRVFGDGGFGFEPGHGGVLRSSLFHGRPSKSGLGPCNLIRTAAHGAQAINNTMYSEDYLSDMCVPFALEGARDFLAANNLVALTARGPDPLRAASGNEGTIGEVFVNNHFYGLDSLGAQHVSITEEANCASQSPSADLKCPGAQPMFVGPVNGLDANLRLGSNSPAIDAGDAAGLPVGPSDFYGGAREQSIAIDVGAHERGSEDP